MGRKENMKDTFNRKIDYLRISVTDRCDLRCKYCMPEGGVKSLSHADILSYEEILRVAGCAARLGVRHLKVTGGEPLVRRGAVELIRKLKEIPGIEDVSLTTNGTRLADCIGLLADCGIDGINLSLDTLNPELYEKITRTSGAFPKVMEGFEKALEHPGIKLKINCVPLRIPEQNLPEIAGLAQNHPVHVRFIELMPIGLGKTLPFKSEADTMMELEQAYGTLVPCDEALGNGPCRYYSLPGFQGRIGFISALSHKFCSGCNRIRLTADGRLKTCLQYDIGVNLKELLRSGKSDAELEAAILQALESKPEEHHFTESAVKSGETRPMFQIGG